MERWGKLFANHAICICLIKWPISWKKDATKWVNWIHPADSAEAYSVCGFQANAERTFDLILTDVSLLWALESSDGWKNVRITMSEWLSMRLAAKPHMSESCEIYRIILIYHEPVWFIIQILIPSLLLICQYILPFIHSFIIAQTQNEHSNRRYRHEWAGRKK